MSEPTSGFLRWAQLMDRAARDEQLTPDEQAFCESFGRNHSTAERELAAYSELAELTDIAAPDADDSRAVRTLVDGALSRLEAEEAERVAEAVADARRFQLLGMPGWLVASAAGAALLAVGLLSGGSHDERRDPTAEARQNAKDAQDVKDANAAANAAGPLTRAELVYASGQVKIEGKRAGSAGRVLLGEGTRIETGEGSACVLVDSDINLCLAANSSMRLAVLYTPRRRVELTAGVLATRLSTQPEGQSLTIAAGEVTSTAVGTAFSVEHTPGQPVVTTVLNGKVRVSHAGAERLVNAHERALSSASHVEVDPLSRTEEAGSWALLGPTMLWHDPVSATLELTGEPAGAEAWLDGELIGRAPLSSLVPVGGHHLLVRQENAVLLDREVHWNAGEAHSVDYHPPRAPTAVTAVPAKRQRASAKQAAAKAESNAKLVVEAVPETPALAPSGKPTPADLLRTARREVRDGQLKAAVETYESLRSSFPESEEAHTVLVSLGQLELTALRDPTRALKLLDTYLTRGGTLSEEARLTRIHALRALGRTRDEAAAIAEFLVKHPRSFEDTNLRARLASLRAAD